MQLFLELQMLTEDRESTCNHCNVRLNSKGIFRWICHTLLQIVKKKKKKTTLKSGKYSFFLLMLNIDFSGSCRIKESGFIWFTN